MIPSQAPRWHPTRWPLARWALRRQRGLDPGVRGATLARAWPHHLLCGAPGRATHGAHRHAEHCAAQALGVAGRSPPGRTALQPPVGEHHRCCCSCCCCAAGCVAASEWRGKGKREDWTSWSWACALIDLTATSAYCSRLRNTPHRILGLVLALPSSSIAQLQCTWAIVSTPRMRGPWAG